MLILNQNENVPKGESLMDKLMSIVPLELLKDTPLNAVTREDLINYFFAGKSVTVTETLRPQGIIRITFDEEQTANKVFSQATSIDGIIEAKKQATIAYIKNNKIYVEN